MSLKGSGRWSKRAVPNRFSGFGGSSNGRTADSDSACLGSNPSPPASHFCFDRSGGGLIKCARQIRGLWRAPGIQSLRFGVSSAISCARSCPGLRLKSLGCRKSSAGRTPRYGLGWAVEGSRADYAFRRPETSLREEEPSSRSRRHTATFSVWRATAGRLYRLTSGRCGFFCGP